MPQAEKINTKEYYKFLAPSQGIILKLSQIQPYH